MYSIGYTTGVITRRLIPNGDFSTSSIPSSMSTTLLQYYISLLRNLIEQDPYHILTETFLLATLIYIIIFKRQIDWKKDMRESLTDAEKQEIIQEWMNEKAPLGNELTAQEKRRISDDRKIVIHQVLGSKIVVTDFSQMQPKEKRPKNKDTAVSFDNIATSASSSFSTPSQLSSNVTSSLISTSKIPTRTMLNMASNDFLGMGSDEDVKRVSRETLKKYGCGACGPRGFYGTIDVHLDLEKEMARFCQTETAILYSDAASATTSIVTAFSKRGDDIVVDDGIYEALQSGVTLSRSNVHFFKHNDMDDLRRVLEKIKAHDIMIGRKHTDVRRFIVVEGLYRNYGHVAPIDKIVDLKTEFCYRLIVDESYSFGTLGKNGRGAIEYYGKKLMRDVEIAIISIENAVGSVGGMCVGSMDVVEHQRLSGAGYCFSAASPPFTASAAIQVLKTMESQPELMSKLEQNKNCLYEGLNKIPHLIVTSDSLSSIAILQLKETKSKNEVQFTRDQIVDILDEIVFICNKKGVLVVSTGGHVRKWIRTVPNPAIRMTVTAVHSQADIQLAVSVLKDAAESVCFNQIPYE